MERVKTECTVCMPWVLWGVKGKLCENVSTENKSYEPARFICRSVASTR